MSGTEWLLRIRFGREWDVSQKQCFIQLLACFSNGLDCIYQCWSCCKQMDGVLSLLIALFRVAKTHLPPNRRQGVFMLILKARNQAKLQKKDEQCLLHRSKHQRMLFGHNLRVSLHFHHQRRIEFSWKADWTKPKLIICLIPTAFYLVQLTISIQLACGIEAKLQIIYFRRPTQ